MSGRHRRQAAACDVRNANTAAAAGNVAAGVTELGTVNPKPTTVAANVGT